MRHLRRLGHSLAAGAFAGAALAPLQLLLWPEVSLTPARALVALLAWASWGALWIGGVLFVMVEVAGVFMPYLTSTRGFSVGLWRWLMIVVCLVASGAAWWNREETRDLLLPENRHALGVGATIATLFAISLLVPALQRRARRHPLAVSLTTASVLVAFLWGIWVARPVSRPAEPTVEPVRFPPAHHLLFVSWEGTDLPWLLPAMAKGDMPFLRSRWDNGAWGQLRTVVPYTRSATIATLLTGCAPAVHGVLGRNSYRVPWLTEGPVTLLLAGPWPGGHQLPWRAWERAAGLAPQRGTVWQILLAAGRRVGLAGWPRYAQGTWTLTRPLASEVPPFSTLDRDLQAAFEPAFRSHPDLADDARRSFAVTATFGGATARYATDRPVDALGIDYELAAHLRPLWTGEDPGDPGEDVLHQTARILDTQLRTLWLQMGEDTLLVVVSPYGLAPPSPWQRLAHLGGTPRRWRVSPADSTDGFVLFSGPGVRPGHLQRGRLADAVATVLYLLELPVARDMAGRVLLDAVTDERAAAVPLRLIPSYPPWPKSPGTD
jgi:hypothetical protein